jgi:capsular exopolysaccharide synthesis family protein
VGISSPQLVVTSASPGEGKSTIACNLAATIAYAGKHVVLVDADMRRPSLHRFFKVSNQIGLTTLLLDNTLPVESALINTSVAGLKLMPSGPLPPNPADLLGSEPMKQRLEQIRERADVVIFDTPPVLAVTDAAILGGLCNGIIIVVDAGRTRSQVVKRAKEALDQLDLKVTGVVLNKLAARHTRAYYSYYYSHADSKGQRRGIRLRKNSFTSMARVTSWLLQPLRNVLSPNGRTNLAEPAVEDDQAVSQ